MINSRAVLIFATLAALSWPQHALSLKTLGEFSRSGKIVDATGAPIEDALVIAKWEACYGIGHCNHFCSGYELTHTDINGNYIITGSHRGSLSILDFYKKGYRFVDKQQAVITMQPDPSKGYARLQNIDHLLSGCRYNQKEIGLAGVGRTIFDEVIADLRKENRIDEILNVISFIEQQEIGPSAEIRMRARQAELYRLPSKIAQTSPEQISESLPEPLPRSLSDDFTYPSYDKAPSKAGFSGNTSLINASYEGDIESVEAELKSVRTLNDRNIFGETAMYAASLSGHRKVVSVLLKQNADPDIPNMFGEPPLLAALKNGHIDTATLLINHGADISGLTGKRAAVWAIKNNEAGLLELLLDKGISIYDAVDGYKLLTHALSSAEPEIRIALLNRQIELNDEQIKHVTDNALWPDEQLLLESLLRNGYVIDRNNTNWPLRTAIQRRNEPAIQSLIEHGADVNRPFDNGRTPLIEAALIERNESIIALLLKAGANPNYVTRRNETALYVATQNGNLELMRLLIAAGADVNSGSPLHASAVSRNDLNSLTTMLLLEHGAKPCSDAKHSTIDISTMAAAARRGKRRLINEYISRGCNIRRDTGNSILSEAIKGGDYETVKYVLGIGAPAEHHDEYGVTPLMLAVDDNKSWHLLNDEKAECITTEANRTTMTTSCNYLAINNQPANPMLVRLLIDAGSDLDKKDKKFGLTALMRAAITGDSEIVTLLLESGADPAIRDHSGKTAYMHANDFDHSAAAELIGKFERSPR